MLLARGLCAQDAVEERNANGPEVPEGVKIRLEFDQAKYFLGENVLAHLVIENASQQPFRVNHGGDYRGAGRALRFEVTATDQAGQLAEDPNPDPSHMGGMVGNSEVAPGGQLVLSVPLIRYVNFDRPGRYTIRIAHDFGWKAGGRAHPVGEAVVEFISPDAAQAELIVAAMDKLPDDPNGTFGKRSRNYADFSALRQPAYFASMLRRAEAGDQKGLTALASMEIPEATAALIRLAGHADRSFGLKAAESLVQRLPEPEFSKTAQTQNLFPYFRHEQRRRLTARAWETALAADVRALAVRLLADNEARAVDGGAAMMVAVGTVADAVAVRAAIERALESVRGPRTAANENLSMKPPLYGLLNAMQALRARGYTPSGISGSAGILLYFHWLADEPGPRPEIWLQHFEAWRTSGPAETRIAALRSIPQPMPEVGLKAIRAALDDRDLGVIQVACGLAGSSGDRRFLQPLTEIIAAESHPQVLREASQAAMKLGAHFELLKIWTSRMGEAALLEPALEAWETRFDPQPRNFGGRTDLSRAERLAIRAAWERFLSRHGRKLSAGKKFQLGGPELTPDLFGRARLYRLPGGREWPPPPAAP